MKNIVFFYGLIFIPMVGIVAVMQRDALLGVVLLSLYALVYHPTISGVRLLTLNKISKKEFWKNYIPFWNKKYFRDLFFFGE